MLYNEIFKSLEAVRWNMDTDIKWDSFDPSKLTEEQATTIKMNAITEWSALPATEMFLRDNKHDSDFSAFMSVWFFEEQKHSLVLMEYLRKFAPHLQPTEEELHAVRFEFDEAQPLETLMMHFCGEIRLNHWYRCASEWHTEPVIKEIYKLISQDEARHGGAYLKYMKKALAKHGNVAAAAFAKIGVLMASARRTDKPLHPTNLHVNKALFPNDTIQSRIPDPEWLEYWLDTQINFNSTWEDKVVERILHNVGLLFDQKFATVQELNRYRKEINKKIELENTPVITDHNHVTLQEKSKSRYIKTSTFGVDTAIEMAIEAKKEGLTPILFRLSTEPFPEPYQQENIRNNSIILLSISDKFKDGEVFSSEELESALLKAEKQYQQAFNTYNQPPAPDFPLEHIHKPSNIPDLTMEERKSLLDTLYNNGQDN